MPRPQAVPDPCPQCRGRGWKLVPSPDGAGEEVAVRCECQIEAHLTELLAQAAIPPRYEHCTLENFDLPPGSRELPLAHRQAVAYSHEFPGGIDRDRSGLLFYGSVGAGKTHLAVAILRELGQRGISVRFADFRELLKQIQATFDPANPATEAAVVRPLLEVEVLALDDLGVGRSTEWTLETLHYILNHRYSQRRATIITTNLEDAVSDRPGEITKPTLVAAVGERLRSRLYEMCTFVAMHGEDFRKSTAAPVIK